MEESNETIVGTVDGVLKVRSIQRRPVEERWEIEELQRVQGAPWEPIPGHPEREIRSKWLYSRVM